MKFETLKITHHDEHILILTLNRPTSRNAINSVMMSELYQFWTELHTLNHLRCIIITGEGSAFCAGADLKERYHIKISQWQAQHAILRKAFIEMLKCPIPIIAAVNGAAFGGGLELALASDFTYAVKDAIFAQSEVKVGLMPGAFGTQHLPRACGIHRANELIFTGKSFSADEALAWGIINQICSVADLMNDVLKTAKMIVRNAPVAIREAKKAIKNGLELEAYQRVLFTRDREEGITAFNEKREPIFKGE